MLLCFRVYIWVLELKTEITQSAFSVSFFGIIGVLNLTCVLLQEDIITELGFDKEEFIQL